MGIMPKVKKKGSFFFKTCTRCGGSFGPENFTKTKSLFYPDGYFPICNQCIEEMLKEKEFSWDLVNKFCQYADIPFVPREFERIRDMAGDAAFTKYAEIFFSESYEDLGWQDYFEEFKKLKERNLIEEELPLIDDEKFKKLQEKWGHNYGPEDLLYLENLLTGITTTQNINNALQSDQALKICKMSLAIDRKIESGEDFDKLLSSYDKIVKVAEFTPKNAKNASDFDSIGEVLNWLAKRGYKPKFFNEVSRDVVDTSMKNIQNYNQRLYINESGIGDEITRRIEALKAAKEYEDMLDMNYSADELDKYDNEGWEDLMNNDEFVVDLDGD